MNTKVGRNDPCPCGSGKKLKKCCNDAARATKTKKASRGSLGDRTTFRGWWYPRAADLQLPDVPQELRDQFRRELEPTLRKFNEMSFDLKTGVKGGFCWQTSQHLALISNNEESGVGYVEGIWERASNHPWFQKSDIEVSSSSAHAWNTYKGYPIDLTAECYFWNSSGEDTPWLHEPLKEYSNEHVVSYIGMCVQSGFDWSCVSSGTYVLQTYFYADKNVLPKGVRRYMDTANERKEFKSKPRVSRQRDELEFQQVNQIVFKPAIDRMQQHFKAKAA